MRTGNVALGIVLASLFAAGSSSMVFAKGKPIVEGPESETGVAFIASCDGFDILDEYELNYVVRLFFDEDGDLNMLEEHVWGTDTLFNSETGEGHSGSFSNNVLVDPSVALGANSGIIFRIAIPGEGAVFLDVGRVITNQAGTIVTFQKGPHQFFDGDLDALCDALA